MSRGRSYERRECTEPERGEYKGHPTLTLPYNGNHAFTFGLAKAKAILGHLDEIRSFLEEEGGDEAC